MYELSQKNQLGIYIDYGDVVSLRNNSSIEDFKQATTSYYNKYVASHEQKIAAALKKSASKKGSKEEIPGIFFFLIIMPDTIRQEVFYSSLKNKINADNPVIS